MASVIWDTLDGNPLLQVESSPDTFATKGVLSRPGAIVDMDPGLSHAEILFEAHSILTNAAGYGSPHPENSAFLLRRYQIIPLSRGKVAFLAQYETINYSYPSIGGNTGGTWMLEDTTTLVTREENITGDGKPIRVKYEVYGSNPNRSQNAEIVGNRYTVSSISVSRPTRSIRMASLIQGTPPSNAGEYTGYVNSATWLSSRVASWLITAFSMNVVSPNVYSLSATVTKAPLTFGVSESDWREFVILRDNISGKFVNVADAEMDAARNATYNYGIIYEGNGVTAVGPYPTVDFGTIFGFGS